ncbi:MAG: DUF4294 domain-containing protein [Bacteroidetes bacterium]|nr:MAG: DUF4294 domain-containing protein [Bacteroidota bacterium]
MIKQLLILIFILLNFTSFSQNSGGYVVDSKIIDNDTMPFIRLRTIYILPPHKFKNKRERFHFMRLAKKVKKVLPYAKIAATKLYILNEKLKKCKNDKERKKLIKQLDKELHDEYGDEIKNLTFSEGRILIKLIDRETGSSSFELVKELKGSFTAFLWQSLARVFGENLKAEYDPQRDDKIIEEIVIRIENGQL